MSITLPKDLKDLTDAEEYFDYFGVTFDPKVMHVSRLHILQRFHEYLETEDFAGDEAALKPVLAGLLERAYGDFVRSDPLTERVFKVLKDAPERPEPVPGRAFVPLDEVITPVRAKT
ncbi:MAG: nitrogenase-stabilizing/protective protein NifW [Rhodospirillales bacterium]|nr:nitrogenase-stabilizing/protective protein NifW [Rhodospirillales bacterium]